MKVLPIILVPIVLLTPRERRSFLRLVAGGAVGLLPFVPPLLSVAGSMHRNMLAYNSQPAEWGLNALFAAPQRAFIAQGRYLILASITAEALLSRFRLKLPMTELTALGAALFLFFAPGFGVQYLVFLAPVLCFVDLQAGSWWGLLSGLFAGLVYLLFYRADLNPPQSVFRSPFPPAAVLVGVLAWAYLAQFVWKRLRGAWVRTQAAAPSAEPGNGSVTHL